MKFSFEDRKARSVSLWPGDGLSNCGCDACTGKSASELVWGFMERVAREVYKTHPEGRIYCGAYTSYIDPPESIAKFSPNLYVTIANCGRARMMDDKHWNGYVQKMRAWDSKLAPGRIFRCENNRYHLNDGGDESKPLVYPVIICGLPCATSNIYTS